MTLTVEPGFESLYLWAISLRIEIRIFVSGVMRFLTKIPLKCGGFLSPPTKKDPNLSRIALESETRAILTV